MAKCGAYRPRQPGELMPAACDLAEDHEGPHLAAWLGFGPRDMWEDE